MPYAFVSYQTADKEVAGKIKTLLSRFGIEAFLAHEDISVSEEWRVKILEEIGKADIFICLLSKHYVQSPWCLQESGIAAFRTNVTVIPLSLDGTIPSGFISNIQSAKVAPSGLSPGDLVPGILKHDFSLGIDMAIDLIGRSRDYRSAEAHFQLILPYILRMTDDQIRRVLELAARNKQVHYAQLCADTYIPPLLKSHGHLLAPDALSTLTNACLEMMPDPSS